MTPTRAWVLLKSGRSINLLDPSPDAWEDSDLAIGLSRTYRWGGHSAWDLPLSVAQHSLTVLALRRAMRGPPLSPAEALRELLHDADEGLLSFDCITPVKPHLGAGYVAVVGRLRAAVAARYRLPAWLAEERARHAHADRLAAASEARHVVGWSAHDIRHSLEIDVDPIADDPLPLQPGLRPWEPWPPNLAAGLFLAELLRLSAEAGPAGEKLTPG
ncbi:MAG TPA: phosphohydrolase [Acetobacteraceae bacterium]|nr:phosphohydrolase [Acetobacteraceae bacterium]